MTRASKLFISICLTALIPACLCFAQECGDGFIEAKEVALVGTGGNNAFWARTNRHGMITDTAGNLVVMSIQATEPRILWHLDGSDITLGGVASAGLYQEWKGNDKVIPGELAATLGWKWLNIDVGMKYRETGFDGLSISGGDVSYSGNACELPGWSAEVRDLRLGKSKLIPAVDGSFGDYLMWDKRYISTARLHHQELKLNWEIGSRAKLTLGLEDWAMWGGTMPDGRTASTSFQDYLRIICGASGGVGASLGDQINALGNHLGRTLVQLDFSLASGSLTVAKDTPYEDGSGIGWQNFPDGVWTLYWKRDGGKRWVEGILYDFVYTKWQSGSRHDREATPEEMSRQDPSDPWYGRVIVGGRDNYFNHDDYKSGWTREGLTVGLPLLTPWEIGDDGICMGVENNRIIAHNAAISGHLFEVAPYRLKATWSRNYGTYRHDSPRFDKPLDQLSLGFEGESPVFGFGNAVNDRTGISGDRFLGGISFICGCYADFGDLYSDCFSFCLGARIFIK